MDDVKKEIKKSAKIQICAAIPAVTGDTEKEFPLFRAPCAGKVVKVGIIPQAAVTGAATNHFKVAFINKGAVGVGTDEIAGKAYDNGIDEIAFDFADLGTISNSRLVKDDTVTFAKTTPGSGMNMPDLIAILEFLPDWKAWK